MYKQPKLKWNFESNIVLLKAKLGLTFCAILFFQIKLSTAVFTSYKSRNSSSSIKALVQSNRSRVSLNKVTKILSMTVADVLLCRGTNLNIYFPASRTAFYSQSFLGHDVAVGVGVIENMLRFSKRNHRARLNI